MPRTKSADAMPKKRTVKKTMSGKSVNRTIEHKPAMPNAVCRTCHALPVGSIELMSLLLVLVFSLTAVLVTSVHAISLQQDQIDTLEAQVSS